MTSLPASTASRFGTLVVALLLSAAGCGGNSGPARYDVSGTVEFGGKPVPAGEVILQPDGSQGNAGPGSLALIKDGRYQTAPGKGVVGGPYLVTIMGFDGIPAGDSSTGRALFPAHQLKVEFPTEPTTHDFSVSAAAPRRSR